MVIFVDTSAIYALLDADDRHHSAASAAWAEWVRAAVVFVCSNYVLLESLSLIQRQLGVVAARRFQDDFVPVFNVHWIDRDLHALAVGLLFALNQRDVSLVDCTSFELMRRLGVNTAFAFDPHFVEQGFACLPQSEG